MWYSAPALCRMIYIRKYRVVIYMCRWAYHSLFHTCYCRYYLKCWTRSHLLHCRSVKQWRRWILNKFFVIIFRINLICHLIIVITRISNHRFYITCFYIGYYKRTWTRLKSQISRCYLKFFNLLDYIRIWWQSSWLKICIISLTFLYGFLVHK